MAISIGYNIGAEIVEVAVMEAGLGRRRSHCPKYLGDEGKRYWHRHHARLVKAGLLTEADEEGFAILCMTWEQMLANYPPQDSKQALNFNSLNKQYERLAKQFNMLPVARLKSKINTEQAETDEYGL